MKLSQAQEVYVAGSVCSALHMRVTDGAGQPRRHSKGRPKRLGRPTANSNKSRLRTETGSEVIKSDGRASSSGLCAAVSCRCAEFANRAGPCAPAR